MERPSNQMIRSFLKQKKHYQLFIKAIHHPSQENKQRLNDAFRDYYTEVHLTRYISQTISRYAKDFLAKEKNKQNHYLLTLDKPISSKENATQQSTYGDLIVDGNYSTEAMINKKGDLLDHIENRELYECLKQLTKRQFLILNFYFFSSLTYNEISSTLDISKQAVSKTMRQTLSKLRKHFAEGDNHGYMD